MKKKGAALAVAAVTGGIAAAWAYTEAIMSMTAARSSPIQKIVFKKKELSPAQAVRKRASKKLLQQPLEEVSIRNREGLLLYGHFYPCDKPQRILIMAHGWRSSWHRDFGTLVPFLHKNGCSMLLIEQRAHGKSEGEYISYGVMERFDVADWLSYVTEKHPDLPVYLMGMSMGAATVLMTAGLEGTERLSGIIADCAYSAPYEIVERTISRKIKRPSLGGGRDVGIIEVAFIVIDRAATRDPADDADAVRSCVVKIDLGIGTLAFSENDRGGVLPEHHDLLVRMGKEVFLNGKIAIRVGR
jgi:pimeloyl-ACP methyl ester carboxylesterase